MSKVDELAAQQLSSFLNKTKLIKHETWVASQGQTLFTLTLGQYVLNTNSLIVMVDGKIKDIVVDFTETSITSFTLTAAVNGGIRVSVIYFDSEPPTVGIDFARYHIASGDHDGRYYTKILTDSLFASNDDISTNRKLSSTGDFTGTWNGVTMTESDPGLQAAFDEHLIENITQFNNISKKVNDRVSNLIASGSGLLPTALSFDVASINRSQHMTIPVYDNDFHANIDNTYESEFDSFSTNGQAKYTWGKGQLAFDNALGTLYDTGEIHIKSPVSFKTGSFVCEVDILSDHEHDDGTGTSMRVGVMKDTDNFCMANYDRYAMQMKIIYKIGGTIYGSTFTYQSFTAPYTLMMIVSSDNVTMAVKKDGIINWIGEAYVGLHMSFNNPDILNNWKLCTGYRGAYSAPAAIITGLRGSYSSGMCIGADYHAMTYEDGCPIKNGNAIYFTASIHNTNVIGGSCGVNIYKLDLNSYKLTYQGQIHYKSNASTNYFGGASSKILYDRNLRKWICQATDFKVSSPHTYIGTTTENLLTGVHVIEVQEMDIPDKALSTWDFDIMYDSSDGKYKCIYAKDVAGGITLCEASDVLGTWTKVLDNLPVGGEGFLFFHCNGKYYISMIDSADGGLKILNYPDLTVLGVTTVSKWCNKSGNTPHSWGQIVSLNNGDKTSFYMLIFSGNKWGGAFYGYGDLWIYKARETETGIEFVEDNVLNF